MVENLMARDAKEAERLYRQARAEMGGPLTRSAPISSAKMIESHRQPGGSLVSVRSGDERGILGDFLLALLIAGRPVLGS
jgi:hypothetical protein